jgi:hypothetical protein
MLCSQAHTLDVIFNTLAQRAAQNIGTYMGAADTYMRLALKAQSQCRTTIEALQELKYPKAATFIKQANVGNNVQVNNGAQPHSSNFAQEKDISPSNKLLTESAHATLDSSGAGAAIRAHSELETVAAINRAENKRRKEAQ